MSNTSRLYGLHAVQTVLTQSPERIVTLWLDTARQDQRLQQLAEMAKKAKWLSPGASARHWIGSPRRDGIRER